MRSQISVIALALLCAFAASPADAQAKRGWGLSAGVGYSQVKDVDSTDTFEGNAFGFSAEGEYRFTPYFALGIGGFNLGESSDNFEGVDTDLRVRGFGYFARAIYPASEKVDLYARVGGVAYKAELSPGGFSSPFGEDALELGLGVDIGSGNNIAFRIEARYFNGVRDETGGLLTAGISYRF